MARFFSQDKEAGGHNVTNRKSILVALFLERVKKITKNLPKVGINQYFWNDFSQDQEAGGLNVTNRKCGHPLFIKFFNKKAL